MPTTTAPALQVADEEATRAAQEAENAAAAAEGRAPATVAPVTKAESVTVEGWAVQNDNKPLWTRPAKEVSPS
jgi:hypothetical protein